MVRFYRAHSHESSEGSIGNMFGYSGTAFAVRKNRRGHTRYVPHHHRQQQLCATVPLTSWLSMNSQTPSLASTRNSSSGFRTYSVTSGRAMTPTCRNDTKPASKRACYVVGSLLNTPAWVEGEKKTKTSTTCSQNCETHSAESLAAAVATAAHVVAYS